MHLKILESHVHSKSENINFRFITKSEKLGRSGLSFVDDDGIKNPGSQNIQILHRKSKRMNNTEMSTFFKMMCILYSFYL